MGFICVSDFSLGKILNVRHKIQQIQNKWEIISAMKYVSRAFILKRKQLYFKSLFQICDFYSKQNMHSNQPNYRV